MILPEFDYQAPQSIEQALQLFAEAPHTSWYLSGGTDLLPQARAGSRKLEVVIDIKRIDELCRVQERDDKSIAIGASATVFQVAHHPRIMADYSILRDCCLCLGSYPLRNRATVVGNICNASPCADTAAALLALDAIIVTQSLRGRRRIPITSFFVGPGQNALKEEELVVEILIPSHSTPWKGHYGRLSRRRSVDISTVAVLVAAVGEPSQHRISLLSVAPTPLRVFEAEQILDQKGPAGIQQATEATLNAIQPITDIRGSAEYRREMVSVLLKRGVRALNNRTGESQ